MPARNEEIEHGDAEGIAFQFLTAPVKLIGKDGWVTGIECLKMKLGKPDESGRRHPIPIEGSNFFVDVDAVIIAVGSGSNPLLAQNTPDLKFSPHGNIELVEPEFGVTAKEGVFAGGDIVTGAAKNGTERSLEIIKEITLDRIHTLNPYDTNDSELLQTNQIIA